MFPLALLPFELILVGFVAAQSSPAPECMHEGLSQVLNNQYGQSPCTVQDQLMQTCKDTGEAILQNCTCNTVMYSLSAACAACQGEGIPPWAQWASSHMCDSTPAPFPSHVQVENSQIPNWAYQQLSSNKDFDLTLAIEQSNSSQRKTLALDIGVPIAIAVGVAVFGFLALCWYSRRRWGKQRNARMKTLPLLPGEHGIFLYPQHWFNEFWAGCRSRRLRSSRKDSNWGIDDVGDIQQLRYFSPPGAVQSRTHQTNHIGAHPSHVRDTSSVSLLSRVDLPDVRVPGMFNVRRWFSRKGGFKTSKDYKAKYVSPGSPDHSFRIDGSGQSPVTKKFGHGRQFSGEEDYPGGEPVLVERGDFELSDPRPQNVMQHSVLIISHDGKNFDDASTVSPGPLTPPSARSTTRQPPSAYSGARTTTMSGARTTTMSDASSWDPTGRHRANTSSTVSGAYPHELRRDMDLASPPLGRWTDFPPSPPPMHSPSGAFPGTARTAPADLPVRVSSPEQMGLGSLGLTRTF